MKARSAISSESVNGTPAINPLPTTPAHPTDGRTAPWLVRVSSHDVARDRDRLPDDERDEDPDGDRRGDRLGQQAGMRAIPAFANANNGTIT